jgi:hypothetical protein
MTTRKNDVDTRSNAQGCHHCHEIQRPQLEGTTINYQTSSHDDLTCRGPHTHQIKGLFV